MIVFFDCRTELEYDLEFRGFIVLQNKLKPESTESIASLENANIKTVMATGKLEVLFFLAIYGWAACKSSC